MFDTMATVHKTDKCGHMPVQKGPIVLDLEKDTIIVDQYVGIHRRRPHALEGARIWICPTAGIPESRWYTLWWLRSQKSMTSSVMLRGRDCCVVCAVEQAARRKGEWCVVL